MVHLHICTHTYIHILKPVHRPWIQSCFWLFTSPYGTSCSTWTSTTCSSSIPVCQVWLITVDENSTRQKFPPTRAGVKGIKQVARCFWKSRQQRPDGMPWHLANCTINTSHQQPLLFQVYVCIDLSQVYSFELCKTKTVKKVSINWRKF